MTTTAKITLKDLVCGMDAGIAIAAEQSEYKGHTHFFGGLECKQKFDLDSEQYLGKSGGSAKSGCGCCNG